MEDLLNSTGKILPFLVFTGGVGLYIEFILSSMQLTELNHECLLHIFSFLDKETRKSTSLTCHKLCDVFMDPALWSLLNFSSPSELREDNFLLSPMLRSLSICWYSSRVKICNIEDWMKSNFQRDICSKHENLINNFLNQISNRCPNLVSLTLSGCGHVTDYYIIQILHKCTKLKVLKLENCVRMTDKALEAVTIHGINLRTLHVDFCRNITQGGLLMIREKCRSLFVSADRSAGMIPDNKPEETDSLWRGMKKRL